MLSWVQSIVRRIPSPLRTAALLCLLIAVLLPPYLVHMEKASPSRSMEKICMLSSQETWLLLHEGRADAWQTPSMGGVPRIEKPPLLIWLNLLAWRGLDPATATVEDLAFRARAVTTALVMLAAACACWAGCTLGDRRTGLLAALITGSMFLIIKQGHYATYDPQVMGWATLAVAAALWAVQPMHPERLRRRHAWGWLLAGLALACGVMTKGPVALSHVLLPVAWVVALTPHRRRQNITGLLAAVGLCVLLSAWWYWHVIHDVLGAAPVTDASRESFMREYVAADRDQRRPFYYYALVAGFVFPWSCWWVLSWFQPFREKAQAIRRPAFLAWGWFMTAFVAAAIWPMRHERYLVPLMPAVGVMCALWFVAQENRYREAAAPAWLRRLWDGSWIVLAIAAPAPLFFVQIQSWLLASGRMQRALLVGVGQVPAACTAALLLGLCWWGWRLSRRRAYVPAAAVLGLWMVALTTVLYLGYSQAPGQQYAYRTHAERLAAACGGMPAYCLMQPGQAGFSAGIPIYARQVIRPADMALVESMMAKPQSFAVAAVADTPGSARLLELGFTPAAEFRDTRRNWILFRRTPAPRR